MLFAFLNKGNLQLQVKFPSVKLSPKIKSFPEGCLEQESKSFLFPFVCWQSFLFAFMVEPAYAPITVDGRDPPGGLCKTLVGDALLWTHEPSLRSCLRSSPCLPHFCIFQFISPDWVLVPPPGNEIASSLIPIYLLSTRWSVVDRVYIKGAKCEGRLQEGWLRSGPRAPC